MAVRGRQLPLLVAGLLWTTSLTLCFNLELRTAQLYSYPFARTQGREPYFGFSVALQHNEVTDENWLMVGAPRANSSLYNHDSQITEPGALFGCDLSGSTCKELPVDTTGNVVSENVIADVIHQDLKNFGWLGGSLDSQPHFHDGRQVIGVCAPRWKNQFYYDARYMNGACYWFNGSDPNPIRQKLLPLVSHDKQTRTINYVTFYRYGFGQAGISIHFPDDQTNFIIGAPGVFNWRGTVIRYKDTNFYNPEGIARRRRQAWRQRYVQPFGSVLRPDPFLFSGVVDFDLFGYAVTSGKFLSQKKILYAASAPRGAESYGKVIVFDFPDYEYADLLTRRELKGSQLGEYFGAALTAADVNGDGLTDLIVGSPMFSLPNTADVGRVQTFLSNRGLGLSIQPEPHYGNKVNVARFGTSLASPGDLNADGYEDIVVGAPWEDNGAVYIFLGSSRGLKQQHSQRLSPEDFTPGLKGFGMSVSRGTDIDKNGYPDLAIGSFVSGHVAVIKTRPVAILSGYLFANPPSVAWEEKTTLTLNTCIQYKGHRIPRQSSINVTLTLDHGSPAPRAVFSDAKFIHTFTQSLVANDSPLCRTDRVTVKEDKIDPDQPLVMKMEYELLDNRGLELIKQPVTNPGEIHSNTTRVGILKGCDEEICRVDMMFDADLDLGKGNKLVVGEMTKPVLRVKVSNNGEPAYLPLMIVKVDPPLTLLLPSLHDCKFLDANLRTSMECSLSNPIKMGSSDTVEVNVDASQLTDGSSNPGIQVDVAGEGKELKPNDNHLFMSLQLEAHAKIELYGHSKEEQVFYKHDGENNINATINPRFTHTYLVMKKGPTPIDHVDVIIDIPVNISDGQKLAKLYPPKTDFLQQPIQCKLTSGSFDTDVSDSINEDDSIFNGGNEDSGSDDIEPHIKPITVSAGKEGDGTQYFNCSSNLLKCAQLSCRLYNWPRETESAKISLDIELDLSVMAKYISIKGGAIFTSRAFASIRSLSPQLVFVGEKVASGEAVTHIQSDTLQTKGVPWWVILLAVLGGLLLLGLMAYGLYKAGFFKREKMEEMKAQQASLVSNAYGT